MAVSKRIRFEVFKRDAFACQYCGRRAPDVLLHVDHVVPVVGGGSDDMINLVTSCQDCNLGKGARELTDQSVLERQRRQLENLQERREQIEMMVEWQRGLLDIEDHAVNEAASFWSDLLIDHFRLNEVGEDELKQRIDRFGLDRVLDAMKTAVRKYVRYGEDGFPTQDSVNEAWKKVGGICYNKSKWEKDPDAQAVDRAYWHFVRLYREQCSHYPDDGRIRGWWDREVAPFVRGSAIDDAARIAEIIVGLCLEEYSEGGHTSYWSACEAASELIEIGLRK